MRTTLELDERLVEEVTKLTKEKSKSKAVNKALEEYLRNKKIDELFSMAGKVDLVDNWRELEELELKEMQW
ncbi:MAG: type II toxin-antitoxin system VapB family antitoxin [Chloroflexi bacterium]|nr:type II toxin-antitoxin system VapB family antitoxin [Chloroflexota bacterium]